VKHTFSLSFVLLDAVIFALVEYTVDYFWYTVFSFFASIINHARRRIRSSRPGVRREILPVYDIIMVHDFLAKRRQRMCACMLYIRNNECSNNGDDNAGETWFSCAF